MRFGSNGFSTKGRAMFRDNVWWITGASSGIGMALATALSDAGAKVILSGRNRAALDNISRSLKTEALVLPFETTDFEYIPEIADQAWRWASQYGSGIHGLVNNAGITQRSLAVDTVFDVYRRIVDVDLLAPIALTQALVPRMAAAGRGHIVAISSIAGIAGVPMRSAYSAAKHGLIGYHDSLRAETDHLGLRVLVVCPGSVRTNVSKNALNADGTTRGVSDAAIDQGMDPGAVAMQILDSLQNGERELILADGAEAQIARMRRSDPGALFDLMAQMVANGYARQFDNRKAVD